EFDVKLLDLLLATPYTSEALANALNVADGTVTTRINRFIEAGIVTGWPRLHRLGFVSFFEVQKQHTRAS
ncbi:MAG: winged helix-turn-helix domain-containing protein, partial [Candidatus Hodarchaeales archaeon]